MTGKGNPKYFLGTVAMVAFAYLLLNPGVLMLTGNEDREYFALMGWFVFVSGAVEMLTLQALIDPLDRRMDKWFVAMLVFMFVAMFYGLYIMANAAGSTIGFEDAVGQRFTAAAFTAVTAVLTFLSGLPPKKAAA